MSVLARTFASSGHNVVVTWFALCKSNYTEDLHVLCEVNKFTYNGDSNKIYFCNFLENSYSKSG